MEKIVQGRQGFVYSEKDYHGYKFVGNFQGATFTDTNLKNADLSEARSVNRENLNQAACLCGAKLPPGLSCTGKCACGSQCKH